MNDLFVVKSASAEYGQDGAAAEIAGTWELDDLEAGALALFDTQLDTDDGVLLSATNPSPLGETFQIALCREANDVRLSPMISRDATLTWHKELYSAPVAKVMYVGAYNNTVGLLNAVTGSISEWELIITDRSKEHYDTSRTWSLSGVTTAADTESTIADKILLAWAADPKCAALGTLVKTGDGTPGYGFSITGVVANQDFTVHVGGCISAANVYESEYLNHVATKGTDYGSTAKAFAGEGTPAQLLDLEKEAEAKKGVGQHSAYSDVGTPTSMVDTAATYVVYTFKWRLPFDEVDYQHDPNPLQQVVVGINASNAGHIAALDAIIDAL